jgi:hypothetical protein
LTSYIVVATLLKSSKAGSGHSAAKVVLLLVFRCSGMMKDCYFCA